MRAITKHTVGHVAVVAKHAKTRGIVILSEPVIHLASNYTRANLLALFVAAAVDVIYSKKLNPMFTATFTLAAVMRNGLKLCIAIAQCFILNMSLLVACVVGAVLRLDFVVGFCVAVSACFVVCRSAWLAIAIGIETFWRILSMATWANDVSSSGRVLSFHPEILALSTN